MMVAVEEPEENPDSLVSNRLCEARRDAIREEIHSLKLAVYAVGLTITIVLTVVQVFLKLTLG